MEENNIKKSFTFVGYMENEFLIVDLEKEDSENSNSLQGDFLKDSGIKKEKNKHGKKSLKVCENFCLFDDQQQYNFVFILIIMI